MNSLLKAVECAARINGTSTFVVDFDAHKLIYRTDHLVYIEESAIIDQKRECVIPYWSIISEDTIEKLLQIKNHYLQIDKQISREDNYNHVCIIDYPIILRNHELFITQKFTPLVVRNDGITKIGMFTIGHSNKTKIESYIIIHSGNRFRFNFERKQYEEYNINIKLSNIEKAILHRVQMGMSNGEIATNLYLSINTVKTHRLRIFKKLKAGNINEALTMVRNYHLI